MQPLPTRLDPSRLPGSRAGAIVDAAAARPRRFAVLVVILIAIVAIPAMLVVAFARMSGRD